MFLIDCSASCDWILFFLPTLILFLKSTGVSMSMDETTLVVGDYVQNKVFIYERNANRASYSDVTNLWAKTQTIAGAAGREFGTILHFCFLCSSRKAGHVISMWIVCYYAPLYPSMSSYKLRNDFLL